MKTLSSILLFATLLISSCSAQSQVTTSKNDNFYEIKLFNKVLAYSKIAKEGRTSVFMISTPWCGPCRALKNQVNGVNENYPNTDFYYVNMAYGHRFDDLKRSESWEVWQAMERVNQWPAIVIISPTNNIIKRYTETSLEEEGYKGSTFDRMVEILGILQDYSKFYNDNLLVTSLNDNSIVVEKVENKNIVVNNNVAVEKVEAGNTDIIVENTEPITEDIHNEGTYFIHVVEPNDSIRKLAKRFNVTEDDIAKWNNIENKDNIQVGQEIKIYK